MNNVRMPNTNQHIQSLVSVAQSFTEKGHQLDVHGLTAFGIALSTRYAKSNELREMLLFAECVAEEGLASFVQKVFYDSKAGICSFTFVPGFEKNIEAVEIVFACANQSISQFYWIDGGPHGLAYR